MRTIARLLKWNLWRYFAVHVSVKVCLAHLQICYKGYLGCLLISLELFNLMLEKQVLNNTYFSVKTTIYK